ncbi:3-dehydroquinate synthase [Pseudoflavonifractor sp. MSJ-37]|uniref:3-dehydroquinate synthase n=1 Tax=Pseudoflavonifractor sp. MSJ-37 TaxID=2841531 RepID=UPI001C121B7D|nr:3-dehydroquinate synthase [Pseudoflavonifractor sp. MSJ-37]MBU5436268.1 3-dehydroquinate synthase [Pseudoflavonifractor sp. MSJ-37]
MRTLTVDLPGRAYDIQIQRGLLDLAGERCRTVLPKAARIFLVTDSNVEPLYLERTAASLRSAGFRVSTCTVPAGESAKCPEELAILWENMMSAGLTRTDAVAALGGGVVGDLAGFAAATILRGVDFIQIPTTLLAQVDSSVGGKVAVDLRAGKNLAGAFWQPKLVLMDPDVLDTLPDSTFADGMAEVIKYGCIFDRAFFDFLAARPSRKELMADIEHILYTCCDWKRSVVVEDERDTGRRMLLNFGHTLGHAYELAGHYETWTHGQAVAAGMVLAAKLGTKLGLTPPELAGQIERAVTALGLPGTIECSHEEYVAAIGLDKKGAGDDISLIVLEEMGKAVPHRMSKAALLEAL